MEFAILDGVIIAVVLISALLAMLRGFVREILSIAAWVAAAVLAYLFYEDLLPYVLEYVNNETLAIGLSVAAIFLVSLIIVSLITMKISDFVMDSPVGVLDRLLGFIFGAARGLLLVIVAVIFFNYLVEVENRPEWVTTAATYPELSRYGEELLAAIPDDPEGAIRGAFEEIDETEIDVDAEGEAEIGEPATPTDEAVIEADETDPSLDDPASIEAPAPDVDAEFETDGDVELDAEGNATELPQDETSVDPTGAPQSERDDIGGEADTDPEADTDTEADTGAN